MVCAKCEKKLSKVSWLKFLKNSLNLRITVILSRNEIISAIEISQIDEIHIWNVINQKLRLGLISQKRENSVKLYDGG